MRGQRRRICPECGLTFRAAEAKIAGLAHDPVGRDDLLAIHRRRARLVVGLALVIGALILALISTHAAVIVLFAFPFLIVAIFISFDLQHSFDNGVLFFGLAFLVVTIVLILLFA